MTEFVVDNGAIRNYKRLSYTPWHALAEFVDNSTQAYSDNEDQLDQAYQAEGTQLKVDIDYDGSKQTIEIRDNSMGMDNEILERAMRVGQPPPNADGRSRYGMGMKTAACWLGDYWTVRTSKLGDKHEYTVIVDVEKIANGQSQLPTEVLDVDPDSHYTVIEISRLNVTFKGKRLGKTKDFLASMYRKDIRTNRLELTWQGEPVRWHTTNTFLRDNSNQEYRRELSLLVELDDSNKAQIEGWVAILEQGSRSEAGFSIFHRDRMIKGYPDSWRPQEIFGQEQGSNNLVNQRIVGEFNLDDFDVTHTKDDIQWSDEEAERVERAIRSEIADYLIIAETVRYRKREGPQAGSIKKVRTALSKQMNKRPLTKSSIPDDDAVRSRSEEVQATTSRFAENPPDLETNLLNKQLRAYFSDEESSSAIFASVTKSEEKGFVVVANLKHPFLNDVVTTETLELYLRLILVDIATLDEVVDWDSSPTWLAVRDSLMRTMVEE